MQERYLGDIHDYFKFLFLKFLSKTLKIKIGLNYRKDQGLAVLKDKTKSTAKKFKSKVYGVTDLLKTKID